MDLKIAARIIAVLTIGGAMLVAVVVLRKDGPEADPALGLRDPGGEPSHADLLRCRDIGVAALDDAGCRKAWAENRRRFFESDRQTDPMPERFGYPSPQSSDWPRHVPDLNSARRP